MNRILIVEDDRALNAGLKYDFEKEGYQVSAAFTVSEAWTLIKKDKPDLVILDVNLPDQNGFSFCRQIKEEREIPVIFLTARDLEEDAVKGYDLGADDYITKPFSMVLLRKKVEVILRRTQNSMAKDIYEDENLYIDFAGARAKANGQEIAFTPTEYRLLKMFLENKNQVLTHKALLERLWDSEGQFVYKHTLAVNINRLRGKIETEKHKYIATVYGFGYQWIGEK